MYMYMSELVIGITGGIIVVKRLDIGLCVIFTETLSDT